MWKKLRKTLELEDPTPFNHSVYLGCGQHEFTPPREKVLEKRQAFHDVLGGLWGLQFQIVDPEATGNNASSNGFAPLQELDEENVDFMWPGIDAM